LFLTPIETVVVLISRAVKTYCGDDNGRSSENRTQRKNTAADGCDI
jgi:hypothetical protein